MTPSAEQPYEMVIRARMWWTELADSPALATGLPRLETSLSQLRGFLQHVGNRNEHT